MTNILGETVNPNDFKLHFEWVGVVMNVLRGEKYTNAEGIEGCQKYLGTVSPNGYNGYSANVHYKLGEPILINWHEDFSFEQMNLIMAEYRSQFTPRQCLDFVINRIAKEKKLTVDETIKMLVEKKIPVISI